MYDFHHVINAIKHILDAVSVSAAFATLIGLLPPLAALLSILWIVFQFYHSQPVKAWRSKRKASK